MAASKPFIKPKYDTMLIDTSVVAHLCYHSYYCQQDMDYFVDACVFAYNFAPMVESCKNVVWCGDFPPYHRRLNFSTYKGSRPPKGSDLKDMIRMFNEKSNAVRFPHYEADDVIRAYVDTFTDEKILILTVDSDLLQLLKENVDWCCAKGYPPQFRSLRDGSFSRWFDNKLKKISKKKVGHLDRNSAQSIVDWKVACGDQTDKIPAGENYRWLIDLRQNVDGWRLEEQYPEYAEVLQAAKIPVQPVRKKLVYDWFQDNMHSRIPTPSLWSYYR